MAAPPPRLRSRRDAPALPTDLLHEILLRLPAADACRLRAVCRPWRAVLSDPLFAAAHAARHTDPLIAVGYDASLGDDRVLCDIVDLSGRVVKRIHAAAAAGRSRWSPVSNERVMCSHLDHVIVARGSSMRCHLLNLTTGVVHVLPEGLAAEHAEHQQAFSDPDCCVSAAFGMVPSTGNYKVLRVLHSFRSGYQPIRKLFEVFTIDGSIQARWRPKCVPPYPVELRDWDSVVIKHNVYFLLSDYDSDYRHKQGLVASFDLETEKWGASIRGPMSRHHVRSFFPKSLRCFDFKIAALGDCLVLGCCSPPGDSPSMDLWFLTDFGKGLWVKQHSIEISVLHVPHLVQPLLVFKDERMENRIGNWAFLKNYTQTIKPSTDVQEMKRCVAVGLYEGNLLSLPNCTR